MAMNNQAQVFFYTLMLGILVIMLALSLAGPLKDTIDDVRNSTQNVNRSYEGEISEGVPAGMINGTITTQGLDCANTSISDFDKAGCLVSDISLFFFIAGIIFIGGSIITARLIFS